MRAALAAAGVALLAVGFVCGASWQMELWMRAVYVDALERACERECAVAAAFEEGQKSTSAPSETEA